MSATAPLSVIALFLGAWTSRPLLRRGLTHEPHSRKGFSYRDPSQATERNRELGAILPDDRQEGKKRLLRPGQHHRGEQDGGASVAEHANGSFGGNRTSRGGSPIRHSSSNPPPAEPAIAGGTAALPGEFPYFATTAGPIVCGASLVWEDVLLSAAHCAGAFDGGVHVGIVNRTNLTDGDDSGSNGTAAIAAAQRRINVVREVVHPDFVATDEPFRLEYDYMVLKLGNPVWGIAPVELNSDDVAPADGDMTTAIGFGLTSYSDERSSDLLLKVDMQVTGQTPCADTFHLTTDIVEDVMLCAGRDGRNICNGDSGGPLLDEKGRQVGITSFRSDCNVFPSVFARVSGQFQWIQDQICDLSDNPPIICTHAPASLGPIASAVPSSNASDPPSSDGRLHRGSAGDPSSGTMITKRKHSERPSSSSAIPFRVPTRSPRPTASDSPSRSCAGVRGRRNLQQSHDNSSPPGMMNMMNMNMMNQNQNPNQMTMMTMMMMMGTRRNGRMNMMMMNERSASYRLSAMASCEHSR